MHLSPWRVGLLVVIFVVSHLALGDQKIKTKSNIKNDRVAESSSAPACDHANDAVAESKTQCDAAEKASSSSVTPPQEAKSQ
jgi:hypothetical protein